MTQHYASTSGCRPRGPATAMKHAGATAVNPDTGRRMLILSKLSGTRAGYMMLVNATDDAKPSDLNRLVIESTPVGSYVSVLQLPEFGMTLHFRVPSHASERQIAKAANAAAASGQ